MYLIAKFQQMNNFTNKQKKHVAILYDKTPFFKLQR